MALFPFPSYLSNCGGELHKGGGNVLKGRLGTWEHELRYLRFRIAEWKQFGSADHPDYYEFRSFLLQKIFYHLEFEMKTLSTILMACEVAADSDDVPPVQSYVDRVFALRERISPGVTRRIHLERWRLYMRIRAGEMDDTPSQMDDMFAKIRDEISGMEGRSKEFRLFVNELVQLVAGMQEIASFHVRLREGTEAAGGGGHQEIRPLADRFVNVDGFWVRSARRNPPHAAHRRDATGARARVMTRSPSDLLPTPILANSRARLPPLTGIHPPPPSPPLPTAAGSTNPPRRFPTSVSGSRRQRAAPSPPPPPTTTTAVISRIISPPPPPPPPPPPRTARNIHRRLFNRVFHMSQNATRRQHPRTPSSADRTPSPIGTPPPSPQPRPSMSGFSPYSYESPAASLIAETRTRLPPPPDSSPIPYRPPGQRMASFLHRL